jgi:hypothetical protein
VVLIHNSVRQGREFETRIDQLFDTSPSATPRSGLTMTPKFSLRSPCGASTADARNCVTVKRIGWRTLAAFEIKPARKGMPAGTEAKLTQRMYIQLGEWLHITPYCSL